MGQNADIVQVSVIIAVASVAVAFATLVVACVPIALEWYRRTRKIGLCVAPPQKFAAPKEPAPESNVGCFWWTIVFRNNASIPKTILRVKFSESELYIEPILPARNAKEGITILNPSPDGHAIALPDREHAAPPIDVGAFCSESLCVALKVSPIPAEILQIPYSQIAYAQEGNASHLRHLCWLEAFDEKGQSVGKVSLKIPWSPIDAETDVFWGQPQHIAGGLTVDGWVTYLAGEKNKGAAEWRTKLMLFLTFIMAFATYTYTFVLDLESKSCIPGWAAMLFFIFAIVGIGGCLFIPDIWINKTFAQKSAAAERVLKSIVKDPGITPEKIQSKWEKEWPADFKE